MVKYPRGFTPYPKKDADKYNRLRWWYGTPLGDLLDKAADIHPDKEAFVDAKSRVSYGEARDKANRLAVGLMDIGIKPMDRVLIQIPNWNEFVFAYFALQKIGAVPVLLIDRYRQFEINHLINITGATSWIVSENYKKTDYIPIVNDVINNRPEIKNIITVRGASDNNKFFSLEKLVKNTSLNDSDLNRLEKRRPDPMQVAHMGPTGGTTGIPKVVPRTHNSLITGIECCSMSWGLCSQDITLIAGPVGHDLSFTKGFIGSCIMMGKIIFLDSTDEKDICAAIENEKVTSIVWVPTLAQRLLQYNYLSDYDLSSLKKMHCGGGAIHPDLVKKIMKDLKIMFHNGYGATEGMTTITRSTDDIDTICNTVGRPTCPYDTYKVIDNNGKTLPVNTSGELVIKGPGVFTGYYNNKQENKKMFTSDGFFKTGDLAVINEKGYIKITGRIKEMINRGGESISSTQIEKLIINHQGIVDVAVISMPDRVMGEKVCAYIQPKSGTILTFEEIISYMKEQKASVLQLPERIEFISQMPYTGVGKIDKKALKSDLDSKINLN